MTPNVIRLAARKTVRVRGRCEAKSGEPPSACGAVSSTCHFFCHSLGLRDRGSGQSPRRHCRRRRATITSAGKNLTVNQSSNRAIINWQGFSVGAGETTRLNLPSSVSAILNRVTGADPSLIAGHLSSNGQVYLINPNGIVVGPNGQINTAGFVASTLNLSNDAFMAGGGMTFKGDSGAGIQVLGSVTASTAMSC